MRQSEGAVLRSINPADGSLVWDGPIASHDQVTKIVDAARRAMFDWAIRPTGDRVAIMRRYAGVLAERREGLARMISLETGKPYWESLTEVAAMIGKVEVSIAAQAERARTRSENQAFGHATLHHRPIGVMAVLGPYNFPGHLPNGHIVPALLAGNAVVFKPSEQTPATGGILIELLHEAGVPEEVAAIVQGDRDTGAALVASDIDGLLFTGSERTGLALRRTLESRPRVLLALEMGGNNPLVAWDGDEKAAATIVLSAFITSGQRCSCARRLIVPQGPDGERIVEAVVALSQRLRVGKWDSQPEPFMGPVISIEAASSVGSSMAQLCEMGGHPLLMAPIAEGSAFVSPAIVDTTGIDTPDEEIFGPVLQIKRVGTFDQAIQAANDTRFGLSAGLISEDPALWAQFHREIRAGVVNWNRPTTGASSAMPFGGLGHSGNFRPSAYYAADYCACPVASFEAPVLLDQMGELVARANREPGQ